MNFLKPAKLKIILTTISVLVLLATAPWMNDKNIQNDILQKYGKQDGSIDKEGNLFCDYESRWLPFGRWVVSCEGGYFVPFFYFKKGNNDNTQKQQIHENNKVETETSDWKTYRNEEYGFEFKYPTEWVTITEEKGYDPLLDNSVLMEFWKQDLQDKDALSRVLSVEILSSDGDISVNENIEIIGFKTVDQKKIGNRDLFVVQRPDQNQYDTEMCFYLSGEFNGVCIIAQTMGIPGADHGNVISKGVFNQILSTFKFTE